MSVLTTLKRMFGHRRAELVACVIGLACGWALSLQLNSDSLSAPPPAEESGAEIILMEEGFSLQDLQEAFIKDLATEFRIDPYIVRLVHEQSLRQVDQQASEWRLLRTPESVTYLLLSVIHAESRGNPNAVGDNGRARGLTQIWVSTARRYGEVSAEELLDPAVNVRFAFEHFRYLLKRYNGNFSLALYGWNRGPGTVDRLIRYGKSPANGYGKKVYQAAIDRAEEVQMMGN